jgi:hypothetical protein
VRYPSISIAILVTGCCYLPAPSPGSRTPPPAPVPVVAPPTPGRTCIINAMLNFPGTKPNGSAWDALGGAPDPFLIVRQDGLELGRTAQMQDQYDVTLAIQTACDHTRAMTIDVADRDVSADDQGATFYVDPGADLAMPLEAGGIIAMITVERR